MSRENFCLIFGSSLYFYNYRNVDVCIIIQRFIYFIILISICGEIKDSDIL